MTMRWMRPPELARQGDRDKFDPIIEGARYHFSRELSLAIWKRVCADATDHAGRRDTEQAERRFHETAKRIAARGGRLRPDVGRLTRVGTEIVGTPLGAWHIAELAPRTPGRQTLVAAEARRWGVQNQVLPTPEEAGGTANRSELPGASEVTRAMAALQQPAPAEQVHHAARSADAPDCSEGNSPGSTPDGSPEVRPVIATLSEQLLAAAATKKGAAEALAAAEPATALTTLREFGSQHIPGAMAPVLRLVTQAAGGEVERVLGAARSERCCRTIWWRGSSRTWAPKLPIPRGSTPTTPRIWSRQRTTRTRSRLAMTSTSRAAHTHRAPSEGTTSWSTS